MNLKNIPLGTYTKKIENIIYNITPQLVAHTSKICTLKSSTKN